MLVLSFYWFGDLVEMIKDFWSVVELVLTWPSAVFQAVRAQPEWAKIVFALCIYAAWTILRWLWKHARRYIVSARKLIEKMERELGKEQRIHTSIIDFSAHNNVFLARILTLGFLYVAGTKLDSFAHFFDGHVLKALSEWLPEELVQHVRWLARDFVQPLAYFVCVILLSGTCNRFWAFNKRHRDFAAYIDRMLALIDRQKARLPKPKLRLSAVSAAANGAAPPVTPLRRNGPVPPPPTTRTVAREPRTAATVLWTLGRIGAISRDMRGSVEAASAVRGGELTTFQFDVRRFATVQTVEKGDQVLFLEHPSLNENDGTPAIYLIAPLGRIGYGVIAGLPAGGAKTYAVDVRDSCGNAASISVSPDRSGPASAPPLRLGDRVSFTFRENNGALVGVDVRRVVEGTGLDLASVD